MKSWKKQEQKRIQQNKKDLKKLRQKIDDRISKNEDPSIGDILQHEMEKARRGIDKRFDVKNFEARKYKQSKYRGATKEQYKILKKKVSKEQKIEEEWTNIF